MALRRYKRPSTITSSNGSVVITDPASGIVNLETLTNGTVTSVSGTTNRITVTNPTTIPVIDIAVGYVGQTSITTLSTVTTGGWAANVILPAYGGTGLATLTAHAVMLGEGTSNVGFATIGTAGRLLIDQGAAADPSFNVVSGDITITNAGVTAVAKIAGTTVSGTTGSTNVVFSTAPTLTNPVVGTQATTDNSTKGASTAYVTTAINAAIAGVNPAVAVQAATTVAGDTSGYTYNNGVSGVGATLTGAVNTALTVDGYTFTAIGQRLLVKNDTQSPSGAFNGVYYVTQVQAALLPLILTRALDYNQPSDMNNTGAIPVVNGTVNGTTSWVLTSQVTTVGTDPLTYVKFSINPTTILTNTLTNTHIFVGNASNVATDVAVSGDATLANTGALTVSSFNSGTVFGTLAGQTGTFSGTSSGTNTGDQFIFKTIAVSGQSNVVADTTSDTVTYVGSGITITTDASTDTITFTGASGISQSVFIFTG